MRSVLHDFLGTYTSRHSDYRGYWVLGHLPLDLREWTLDLLGPAPDRGAPGDPVRRLAICRYGEQVSKSGLAMGRIREAALHVATSSDVVEGWQGNHMSEGRLVRFCVRAVVDNGDVYEDEQTVFVAPHDPRKECRRARKNWGPSEDNASAGSVETESTVAGPPDHGMASASITIFQIKLVHALVFWVLSLCVVYALFSGVTGQITVWTWVAVGLLVVESVVLVAAGWTCPLTILAERQGALRGSVADIFLPKWFADRIFPICASLFAIALLAIALRSLQ